MFPWVPLWPFLVSIHGVAFTVADGTTYFIFYLVKVTQTIHIGDEWQPEQGTW
jgi:hypothetical protein